MLEARSRKRSKGSRFYQTPCITQHTVTQQELRHPSHLQTSPDIGISENINQQPSPSPFSSCFEPHTDQKDATATATDSWTRAHDIATTPPPLPCQSAGLPNPASPDHPASLSDAHITSRRMEVGGWRTEGGGRRAEDGGRTERTRQILN